MTAPPRPALEVAGIFRQYGERYRARHRLPLQQLRVMGAIETCRTAALGGHLEQCTRCSHRRIAYNSCRNRHCPKCQNAARALWVARRKADLLPIEYFHLVFTVPQQLNGVALQNAKTFYTLLLQTSAQTLLTLAADPKHLGAQIGFFSILHTWGQNLLHHPHVHCVVTGGGLSADRKTWKACLPGFFLSVRVLSRLFRRLLLEALRRAFLQGQLLFLGTAADAGPRFLRLLDELARIEWVVYAKPPFGGPPQAIEYLGRYTHRVALSNRRLLSVDAEGRVVLQYRDYRSKDRYKSRRMTLEGDEFIRRFLLHTLPPGFARIRHYGILAGRNKKGLLALCRELLAPGAAALPLPTPAELARCQELILAAVRLCAQCGAGQMIRIGRVGPEFRPGPAGVNSS